MKNRRRRALIPFLSLLVAARALADGLSGSAVPDFHLSPSALSVPTDVNGFQGSQSGPVATYALDSQSFLTSRVVLGIPGAPPPEDSWKALAANPYNSLLIGLTLDKRGDTPGTLAMTAPGCREHMAGLLRQNDYAAGTRQWMADKQSVQLLLAIRTGDVLCLYYRLIDLKGDPGKAVYTRTLREADGLYLFDCQDISSPEILNILGAFIVKGDGGVTVQRNE